MTTEASSFFMIDAFVAVLSVIGCFMQRKGGASALEEEAVLAVRASQIPKQDESSIFDDASKEKKVA